jgi:hypothetical protein
VVAFAITAPINKLKAWSLPAHHTTPSAPAKMINEKIPMLGLAQYGSGGAVALVGAGVGGVVVGGTSDIRLTPFLSMHF